MQFLLETGGFINLIWEKHKNHKHGDTLNHNDEIRFQRFLIYLPVSLYDGGFENHKGILNYKH